jgi:hypothetical protein
VALGQHIGEPCHGLRFLSREEVPVGVHGERDGAMPHYGLHRLRVCSRHSQPSPTGVTQGVKVQGFALMVHGSQEVALIPL